MNYLKEGELKITKSNRDVPKNNPMYPPMLPISECPSMSLDWVINLAF